MVLLLRCLRKSGTRALVWLRLDSSDSWVSGVDETLVVRGTGLGDSEKAETAHVE